VARVDANVGLYTETKQNVAGVKEFSLQTASTKDGKVEFRIAVPYDVKIEKVNVEYRLWSHDMSKLLSETPIDVSQREAGGPWTATVVVDAGALKDSTIEVFCARNLPVGMPPAEMAYRIQLATFASGDKK
jgi:hypothetical protein